MAVVADYCNHWSFVILLLINSSLTFSVLMLLLYLSICPFIIVLFTSMPRLALQASYPMDYLFALIYDN